MRDLLQSRIGRQRAARDGAATRSCGRRWSTRPRSSRPCSTWRSTPATPWRAAARSTVETANVRAGRAAAAGGAAGRRVRDGRGGRHRLGHAAGGARQGVRALLHHQGVGKGSGLGLAQVYGFAKQSGGGVRIETAPGEGTRGQGLPARAAVAEAGGEERRSAGARHGAAGRGGPRRGPATILLVDDDHAVREVTASACGTSATRCWRRAAALPRSTSSTGRASRSTCWWWTSPCRA